MTDTRLMCFIWAAVSIGSSACHSTQSKTSIKALLASPSATVRENLEKSIGDFFNSQPVKLADRVFTTNSTVLVERYQGDKAIPTTQRGLAPVDSFTLLLENNRCVLRHDQSQTLILLPKINCKAD